MALNDIEVAQIKRYMRLFMNKRRPPAFIRDEVDLEYRIWGNDVVICRVNYINKKKYESPIAKMVLNRPHTRWNLYSMNQSQEWIIAAKEPISAFSDAIKLVEDDINCCFFRL